MKTLELSNNEQTQISCLSGGECERLSIVVELFDNPAIFFLMNQPGKYNGSCISREENQ